MKHQITLQDWLSKDKQLPKEIVGEIVNETEKAVRVLYKDMYYWMPKSCVTLTPIKDPPETFGPALMMHKQLFPFQEIAVRQLVQMGSALLADEMGLGKTLQAIATVVRSCRLPALIVCPTSLAINWEREITGALVECNIQRVSSGKEVLKPDMDFYIIPYSLIIKYEEIGLYELRSIILDEIHYVKNYKAKRTKTIQKLCDNIRNKLGLSGTPVINHQTEIFNIFRCIQPRVFGKDYFAFIRQWCIDQGYHKYIVPDHMKGRLNEHIKPYMVRRTKTEVLKELPEKMTSIIPVEIPLKEYHQTMIQIATEYRDEKHQTMSDLVQLEKERQLVGKLKLEPGLELVEDILEQGDPVVVFAVHQDIVNFIYGSLKKYKPCIIIGGQDLEERQKNIDDFQNGVSKVIVVSVQAGGMGITLTRANKCVFFEFDWSAANMRQAEDRLHRIGQKNAVNVYYMAAKNTLDEYMIQVLQGKAKSFHDMIDAERKELLVKFS